MTEVAIEDFAASLASLVTQGRSETAVATLREIERRQQDCDIETLAALAHGWAAVVADERWTAEGAVALARLAPRFKAQPASHFGNATYASAGLLAAVAAGDDELAGTVSYAVPRIDVLRGPIVVSRAATLAAWCAAADRQCRVIDAASEIALPRMSPLNDDAGYRTEATHLAMIPGGQYLAGWDIVVSADRVVLSDTGQVRAGKWYRGIGVFFHEPLERMAHCWPREATTIDDDVVILNPGYFGNSAYTGNFGHWLIGILPRLRALEMVTDLRVAAPSTLTPKERETLAYFGISDSRIVWCDPGARYRFRTVCAMSIGSGIPPVPESVRFVRRNLAVAGRT